MAERAASLKSQWITALKLITVANGYNYTLTNSVGGAIVPEDMIPWAAIKAYVALELGNSVIIAKDSSWSSVFDEIVDLNIVGYVKVDTETATALTAAKLQDGMESLIWDLKKKIFTDLLKVNANDATNPWIVNNSEIKFVRLGLLGVQRNVGIIQTTLKIKIKNQTSSF